MNPFNLKNFKSYGLPLLISFLGYFIGYTQKTNAELEGIHKEQTKITYQLDNNASVLQEVKIKFDELAQKVEINSADIAKCNKDIANISVRIDYLEEKSARYK